MTIPKIDERKRLWRKWTGEAIALAVKSQWEQAAEVNRQVLELSPGDVEAWNRLGKAQLELGDYNDAQEAFKHALDLSPRNAIARKNLDRLMLLKTSSPSRSNGRYMPASFFIEENGKTTQVTLLAPADAYALAAISAGEPVELKCRRETLEVCDVGDQYLGRLPSALGRRLIQLMDGGNRYQAAVFNVTRDHVTILLREAYRHLSQRNVLSFPASYVSAAAAQANGAPARDQDEQDRSGQARDTGDEEDGPEWLLEDPDAAIFAPMESDQEGE